MLCHGLQAGVSYRACIILLIILFYKQEVPPGLQLQLYHLQLFKILSKGFFQSFFFGIGNEDLAEIGLADDTDKPFDAVVIQLFKNIIQQQQGREAIERPQSFILGQL